MHSSISTSPNLTPIKHQVYNNSFTAKFNKSQKKSSHILHLKNQLVKMKQFLNAEMPQLNKIIPNRVTNRMPIQQTYEKDRQYQPSQDVSKEEIRALIDANKKLMDKNQILAQELQRQKIIQRKLSKSLKKHEEMLNNLCSKYNKEYRSTSSTSELDLQKSYDGEKRRRQRVKANKKNNESMGTQTSIQLKRSRGKQVVDIWHTRRESAKKQERHLTQQYDSDKKGKYYQIRVKTPQQFTSDDEQTIKTLKKISELENRIQQLILQSSNTDSRSKKLSIRYQLQKITNKIQKLKQSLGSISPYLYPTH